MNSTLGAEIIMGPALQLKPQPAWLRMKANNGKQTHYPTLDYGSRES